MAKLKPFVLPEIITIDGVNHGSFRGALHAEFQRKQYDLINAADRTKLGISDALMKAWDELIKLEDDVNRRVNNVALTRKSIAKDQDRNGYITSLFGLVSSQRTNPNKTIHEAYAKLADVVQTYRGLQNESLDEKTAHIRGLELDLGKLSAETTTLGLTSTIAELHQVNEEFRALRQKILQQEVNKTLPKSKDIRQQNDKFFKVICRCIELAHFQSTVEADKQAIVDLVDHMKHAAVKSRTTHKTSAAQREMSMAEEYAKLNALLQPLFADFETSRQMTPGSLVFTGHRRIKNKRAIYELMVKDTKQVLWVRIERNYLIEVKSPSKASKATRDTDKPNKPQKPSQKPKDKPSDKPGDKPSDNPGGKDPKGQGEVEIKPKG